MELNTPQAPLKRKVDLVIISDVHLGTFGCRADELVKYLKSIDTKHLILNGDIIDIWQFRKKYFPQAHLKVVRQLMRMLSEDVQIDYITGNHDEALRRFVGFEMDNFRLLNSMVLDLDGQKTWVFHGDVFDVTMSHSKWLTKLGGFSYDLLIRFNSFINFMLTRLGYSKISFSKRIKDRVKGAVKAINNFETTCAEIAIRDGYQNVICGHIHKPEIKVLTAAKGQVNYLNSGDWVENLSALEYHNQAWTLYRYQETLFENQEVHADAEDHNLGLSHAELFENLVQEIKTGRGHAREQ